MCDEGSARLKRMTIYRTPIFSLIADHKHTNRHWEQSPGLNQESTLWSEDKKSLSTFWVYFFIIRLSRFFNGSENMYPFPTLLNAAHWKIPEVQFRSLIQTWEFSGCFETFWSIFTHIHFQETSWRFILMTAYRISSWDHIVPGTFCKILSKLETILQKA